jgi:hypothetical protein
MEDRNTNRLNMIGACITVAESPEYRPVWDAQQNDFADDLAALKTARQATLDLASDAGSATSGAADAKAAAETALENAAYTLARGAAIHFKKMGDLVRRARVDFTKSAIKQLRDQDLITTARDIAAAALSAKDEVNADRRGITSTTIDALNAAIAAFEALVSQPRGSIVSRAALNREIETRVAGLMEAIADMDDLVLQFAGTGAGDRFIAAWKQARIIVDAGHGPGDKPADGGTTPPAPTT